MGVRRGLLLPRLVLLQLHRGPPGAVRPHSQDGGRPRDGPGLILGQRKLSGHKLRAGRAGGAARGPAWIPREQFKIQIMECVFFMEAYLYIANCALSLLQNKSSFFGSFLYLHQRYIWQIVSFPLKIKGRRRASPFPRRPGPLRRHIGDGDGLPERGGGRRGDDVPRPEPGGDRLAQEGVDLILVQPDKGRAEGHEDNSWWLSSAQGVQVDIQREENCS